MIVTDYNYLKNTKTSYCNVFDEKTLRIIQRLKLDLRSHQTGLGLSAIQIGEPYKLFCINMQILRMYITSSIFGSGDIIAFIGCSYKPLTTETRTVKEGCLSIPNKTYNVTRPTKIAISGCSLGDDSGHVCGFDGIILHSWVARVFMHECDHQDNILISDRT